MGRNRGLARVLSDIFTSAEGNAFHKVQVSSKYAGMTIGQLHGVLKEQQNAILVSWERTDPTTQSTDVRVNPSSELVVQSGDTLVVISNRASQLE
jgi:Trk K+ transport system NAD-binding subunit